MTSLYAEIEIEASKQRIWRILTAKEHWIKWNTFLFDCDPSVPLQPGQDVFLSMRRLPQDEEIEFEVLVTRMQTEVCLKWVSSIPGLKTETVFELQEIGLRRTKYVHKTYFYGILTPVILPFIRQDEQRGLRRMARELKRYAERITSLASKQI